MQHTNNNTKPHKITIKQHPSATPTTLLQQRARPNNRTITHHIHLPTPRHTQHNNTIVIILILNLHTDTHNPQSTIHNPQTTSTSTNHNHIANTTTNHTTNNKYQRATTNATQHTNTQQTTQKHNQTALVSKTNNNYNEHDPTTAQLHITSTSLLHVTHNTTTPSSSLSFSTYILIHTTHNPQPTNNINKHNHIANTTHHNKSHNQQQ